MIRATEQNLLEIKTIDRQVNNCDIRDRSIFIGGFGPVQNVVGPKLFYDEKLIGPKLFFQFQV